MATVIDRDALLQVEVDSADLVRCFVLAVIPGLRRTECVYDGEFQGGYSGTEEVDGSVLRLRFRRAPSGWVDFSLVVSAVDESGSESTFSRAYEVAVEESSADAGGPTEFGDRVRDLLVDKTTQDLVIENDDLVLVADEASLLQDLRLRLGFFQGEWFLDESAGLPYFQEILVKNPNLTTVREWFRRTIVETAGVKDLITLDLSLDGRTRRLSVSFRVSTDLGELSATFSGPVAGTA